MMKPTKSYPFEVDISTMRQIIYELYNNQEMGVCEKQLQEQADI